MEQRDDNILNFKIPSNINIQIEQDINIENFISQFQQYTDKIICVVNSNIIKYYDAKDKLPQNLRFDNKKRYNSDYQYYFRSIDDDDLYCVFGRNAAKMLFPRLDEIDQDNLSNISVKLTQHRPISSSMNKLNISSVKSTSFPSFDNNIIQISTKTNVSEVKKINKILTPIEQDKPNNIIIIDKGTKLLFPNSNYSVEITLFNN